MVVRREMLGIAAAATAIVDDLLCNTISAFAYPVVGRCCHVFVNVLVISCHRGHAASSYLFLAQFYWLGPPKLEII